MNDLDIRALIAEHRPEGINGLDEIGFADFAAEQGWPVDAVLPFFMEAYDFDEAGARELLLGARAHRLDQQIEREGGA